MKLQCIIHFKSSQDLIVTGYEDLPPSLEVCWSPFKKTQGKTSPSFFDGLGSGEASKNTVCFFHKTIFVTAVSVVPISFTSVAQRKPSLYLGNVFTSETKSKEPQTRSCLRLCFSLRLCNVSPFSGILLKLFPTIKARKVYRKYLITLQI